MRKISKTKKSHFIFIAYRQFIWIAINLIRSANEQISCAHVQYYTFQSYTFVYTHILVYSYFIITCASCILYMWILVWFNIFKPTSANVNQPTLSHPSHAYPKTNSRQSNRQIGHNKIILLRFPSVLYFHLKIWLCNDADHIYAIWTLTQ